MAAKRLLIGPIAQFWVIPSMTGGVLAEIFGPVLGTGPARGLALIFMVAAVLGLTLTLIALRSRQYRTLSDRYMNAPATSDAAADAPATGSSKAPSAAT